mmetsp:Transcript_16705/g.39335  ORF Transcript_16705/g.39335 Transcript_16705/m.39335 type:complete len:208 (-) Transcript_16705:160-783(-)
MESVRGDFAEGRLSLPPAKPVAGLDVAIPNYFHPTSVSLAKHGDSHRFVVMGKSFRHVTVTPALNHYTLGRLAIRCATLLDFMHNINPIHNSANRWPSIQLGALSKRDGENVVPGWIGESDNPRCGMISIEGSSFVVQSTTERWSVSTGPSFAILPRNDGEKTGAFVRWRVVAPHHLGKYPCNFRKKIVEQLNDDPPLCNWRILGTG